MLTLRSSVFSCTLIYVTSVASAETPIKSPPEKTLSERIQLGQPIYEKNCARCHQTMGEGVPNTFPPLANSDFLVKNKLRVIDFVLHGHDGTVLVKNKLYMDAMPPFNFSDEEVADVLSYIMNSWGNKVGGITPEEVTKERAKENSIKIDPKAKK